MDCAQNCACMYPSFNTAIKSCSHQIRIEHQLTICPQATKRGWGVGVDRFHHRSSHCEHAPFAVPVITPDPNPGWPPKFPHPWPLQNPPPEWRALAHKPLFYGSTRGGSGLVHLRIKINTCDYQCQSTDQCHYSKVCCWMLAILPDIDASGYCLFFNAQFQIETSPH